MNQQETIWMLNYMLTYIRYKSIVPSVTKQGPCSALCKLCFRRSKALHSLRPSERKQKLSFCRLLID